MKTQLSEPTSASTWERLTGAPLSDDFLEWPADMFALTDVLLDRSEAYRFALCPPSGSIWPPKGSDDWPGEVGKAALLWSMWLENGQGALPVLLTEQWAVFKERATKPIRLLAEGEDWLMCESLLTLHAIADEACAGLGVAFDRPDGAGCIYRASGRELLARTGSISRIPSYLLRILPRVRTPPTGVSLRSFSRYACQVRAGVEVQWHKVPARRAGTDPNQEHVNMLLLPWPLHLRESDFYPVKDSVQRSAMEPCGFFTFDPSEKLDLELVARTIAAAREEVGSVDVIVFPESAIDESEIAGLETLLERMGVIFLIAGVRQPVPTVGKLPGNWVHMGINSNFEKGGVASDAIEEVWFHIRQNKHHRWSFDKDQLYQYHLGGALHPHVRWWEATDLPRRKVNIVEFGDELTLISLVCEDLAQIDDVSRIVRSVGPTIVITPLLDGPQLTTRWSARYASVMADDPGSAVLTLSSYGMVQRSRPHGREASNVVGLWKDPVRGPREIPLEPGAQGVLLTICSDRATRRTSDGRLPINNTTNIFDVALHQVRIDRDAVAPVTRPAAARGHVFDSQDLTVLTGWAEGLAEVLAYAPERAESLLNAASANAPWRSALGLPEPSQELSEAIVFVRRAVEAATALNSAPAFDTLLLSCRENGAGENGTDRLVRRVLRSTFEQLRTRQLSEARQC